MMYPIPFYVSLTFGLTSFAFLQFFIWTIRNSDSEIVQKKATPIFIGMVFWMTIQAVLAYKNVYNTETTIFPPKIVLFGVLPALIAIVLLFATAKGRKFIDSLPILNLTYLHMVRIPVEIVLYWLFLSKTIPELMTFEGRNFDILAGISAPIVAYFGISKGKLSHHGLLIWNFICLGLLINIVVIALFSTPSTFQKWAFDQPNIAILNFPFSWLPTFVVPMVLLSYLTVIRRLMKTKLAE